MSTTFPTISITCDLNSSSYHNTTLLVGETKYRGSKFTFNEKKHVTKFKSCLTTNSSAVINYRYLVLDENRRIIHYSPIYSNINLSNSCSSCTIENNTDLVLEIGTYYICIAFSGNGTAGINYQFVSSGATTGVSGGTTVYDLTSIITNPTLQLTSAESYYSVWVEAETYTEPPTNTTFIVPPVQSPLTNTSLTLTTTTTRIRGNSFSLPFKSVVKRITFNFYNNVNSNFFCRLFILNESKEIVYISSILNPILSTTTNPTLDYIDTNIILETGNYYLCIAFNGTGTIYAPNKTGVAGGIYQDTTESLANLENLTVFSSGSSFYELYAECEQYIEPPPPPPPQQYVCENTPDDSLELGDLATVASITLTSGTVQIRGNKVDFATRTKISKIRYYIGADIAFNVNVRAILYTYNLIPIVASPIYNINLNYSTFIPEAWKEIDVDWIVEAGTYCIAIAMEGVGTVKMRYRNVGSGFGISTGVPLSLESLATYILTAGISTNWYSINAISCNAIEYVEPPPIEPPPVEPPVEPPTTTPTGNMLLLAFVFVFIILMLIVLLLGDR